MSFNNFFKIGCFQILSENFGGCASITYFHDIILKIVNSFITNLRINCYST